MFRNVTRNVLRYFLRRFGEQKSKAIDGHLTPKWSGIFKSWPSTLGFPLHPFVNSHYLVNFKWSQRVDSIDSSGRRRESKFSPENLGMCVTTVTFKDLLRISHLKRLLLDEHNSVTLRNPLQRTRVDGSSSPGYALSGDKIMSSFNGCNVMEPLIF